LKKVLERYAELGGEFHVQLAPFLPGLGARDRGSLAGNQVFIDLLKKAGTDPLKSRFIFIRNAVAVQNKGIDPAGLI
jgi:hypothetical protein